MSKTKVPAKRIIRYGEYETLPENERAFFDEFATQLYIEESQDPWFNGWTLDYLDPKHYTAKYRLRRNTWTQGPGLLANTYQELALRWLQSERTQFSNHFGESYAAIDFGFGECQTATEMIAKFEKTEGLLIDRGGYDLEHPLTILIRDLIRDISMPASECLFIVNRKRVKPEWKGKMSPVDFSDDKTYTLLLSHHIDGVPFGGLVRIAKRNGEV